MKISLYPLLLMAFVFAGCKKSSPAYTTMTVYYDSDSAWTTTNVATDNMGNGTVYITGTSADGNKTVSLNINSNYRPGDATYTILNIGSNQSQSYNYSSAQYQFGYMGFMATSGQIIVSQYSAATIKGSFDFEDANERAHGTFTATTP